MELQKNIASVSVVIPCYRCAETIERAVKSVAEQTLKPYEVILVEDCSGDNTLEVLYKLQEDFEQDWIKVISLKENSGPGTARNTGWDTSNQDYIAFLDADDSWHPQKIEIQYGWMIKNYDAMMTGHNCISQLNTNTQKIKYEAQSVKFDQVSKSELLASNRFVTSSVMLKTEIANRFPYGKKYCEDYYLWVNIVFDRHKGFHLGEPLVLQYKSVYGESGLSADLWAMEKGELDVYKNLYSKNLINLVQYLFCSTYSIIKYLKRIVF